MNTTCIFVLLNNRVHIWLVLWSWCQLLTLFLCIKLYDPERAPDDDIRESRAVGPQRSPEKDLKAEPSLVPAPQLDETVTAGRATSPYIIVLDESESVLSVLHTSLCTSPLYAPAIPASIIYALHAVYQNHYLVSESSHRYFFTLFSHQAWILFSLQESRPSQKLTVARLLCLSMLVTNINIEDNKDSVERMEARDSGCYRVIAANMSWETSTTLGILEGRLIHLFSPLSIRIMCIFKRVFYIW